MTQNIIVRVQSVRSQNPFGRGGCIFSGAQIDESGKVLDATSYVVIKATGAQLGDGLVQPGQWYQVIGIPTSNERVLNGYKIRETQINAMDISLLRLSGEHVVTFIAESGDFQGIGMVKARRLWDEFGEDLYRVLDSGDVKALTKLLTPESAQQIVDAWGRQGSVQTMQWLQSSGIDVKTGRKLLAFFGKEAHLELEQDPYRLLSFSASWKSVDSFAKMRFGVTVDDPRRLRAAVEEALYRIFDAGDTVADVKTLITRTKAVLGPAASHALVSETLENGISNGSYVLGLEGMVCLVGPEVMERTVAQAIANRLLSPDPLLNVELANSIIEQYESDEGLTLNAEQRAAVHCAARNKIALILGGAGVGKTTVLKGIYRIFDAAGIKIFQMALSGRAAKRMTEATGRESSTLARFFKNTKESALEVPAVVVVDEASMVDIISMHRLCEMLPAHVRLLLVGDTAQLMPVGPGLVLHALARRSEIPMVQLIHVRRYGGAIAAAAADIRIGQWPEFSDDANEPISFLQCSVLDIPDIAVELYALAPDITQILSSRRSSLDGTKNLNLVCQSKFSKNQTALTIHNDEFDMPMGTGLHLGDVVLCTRNLWDWGLQNGSLGKLVEIEPEPRLLSKPDGTELGYALAWVLWDDGERRPIVEETLDDIELGYAITIHKSQGSQWQRIIVVLTGNRLLDRTLIYTAITRAQSQVIIIGDAIAAKRAIEASPRSDHRKVGLDAQLVAEIVDDRPELAHFGH